MSAKRITLIGEPVGVFAIDGVLPDVGTRILEEASCLPVGAIGTDGIQLAALPSHTTFMKAVHALVAEVATAFPEAKIGAPCELKSAFVIRYTMAESAGKTSHCVHTDGCDLTINVCLSPADAFSGSRLYFKNHGFGTRRKVCAIEHKPMRAVIHDGRIAHGSSKLLSGERYNLIVFCSCGFTFVPWVQMSLALQRRVGSFLSIRNLCRVSAASRASRVLANSDCFWRPVFDRLVQRHMPHGPVGAHEELPSPLAGLLGPRRHGRLLPTDDDDDEPPGPPPPLLNAAAHAAWQASSRDQPVPAAFWAAVSSDAEVEKDSSWRTAVEAIMGNFMAASIENEDQVSEWEQRHFVPPIAKMAMPMCMPDAAAFAPRPLDLGGLDLGLAAANLGLAVAAEENMTASPAAAAMPQDSDADAAAASTPSLAEGLAHLRAGGKVASRCRQGVLRDNRADVPVCRLVSPWRSALDTSDPTPVGGWGENGVYHLKTFQSVDDSEYKEDAQPRGMKKLKKKNLGLPPWMRKKPEQPRCGGMKKKNSALEKKLALFSSDLAEALPKGKGNKEEKEEEEASR